VDGSERGRAAGRGGLGVLVAAGLVLAACSRPSGAASPTPSFEPLPSAGGEPVVAVVRRVLPAVVNVTTDVLRLDEFGNPVAGRGIGTGFIVTSDGVIVTNCHVIEGASRITVSTSDAEPRRFDARVIGGDCENDLAVLDVEAQGLPTVELGDSSSLQLGQRVVAIGYALGLEGGPSVTAGIVSSLDRTIRAQDPNCSVCANGVRVYAGVIQTDAAISGGNSGGPLVDMQGRVVAINSAGSDPGQAENIGFSIPIDRAKEAIRRAIEDPLAPAAYLGVTTDTVTPDVAFQLGLSVERGALVLATIDGGPAEAAGIERGDVIIELDGRPIATRDDLGAVLEDLAPGDRVSVGLVGADGAQRRVEVTLGTRPLPVGRLP
jgi:S1-C subfamily serine protease